MGVESKELKELKQDDDPIEALFGSLRRRTPEPLFPENTSFKVFTGCLNEEADRLEYESLLTRSFKCGGKLKNPGDMALLTLNGTFDKAGKYHVACRYAILMENNNGKTSD